MELEPTHLGIWSSMSQVEFYSSRFAHSRCYLGVLAPSDDIVPPFTYMRWTIVKMLDKFLEDLTSRPKWSMFGIRHSQLTPLQGDLWIDGISKSSWVVNYSIVRHEALLHVKVEQRRSHIQVRRNRLERVLPLSLARVNPERAANLNLNISFVKKCKPSKIEEAKLNGEYYATHKWLAYAD